MTKYKFGIGSSVYELHSDDYRVAVICMCLFYKTDTPIVIYEPKKEVIFPKNILKKYMNSLDDISADLSICFNMIKEVKE